MITKIDSLNLISSVTPTISVPKTNVNIEVFSNNKESNTDEVSISNKSDNSPEKKGNNKKNWLIGTGIAFGVIGIGIAAACILKKSPNFLVKKNAQTVLATTGKSSGAVNTFPNIIKNKNGIELRADNSFYKGQYYIHNSKGEYGGNCILSHGLDDIGIMGKEILPDSWVVNGEIKPFLEIGELFIEKHGNNYGRKTMQALYELSLKLGYGGRLSLSQLDTANGFYTKVGFSNDGNIFRFFTPSAESLAKLYKKV